MIRFLAALILVLAAPLVAAFSVRSTPALAAVVVVEMVAVAVLLEALSRRAGRKRSARMLESAERDYGRRAPGPAEWGIVGGSGENDYSLFHEALRARPVFGVRFPG